MLGAEQKSRGLLSFRGGYKGGKDRESMNVDMDVSCDLLVSAGNGGIPLFNTNRVK